MSVIDHNITIYGKGLLKRPFISLKDFVRSIVNLTTYKQKKTFEVFNQYTELLCIKDLGATICSAAKKKGSKSTVKIIKNTSSLHNEFLLHRISEIPIFIENTDTFLFEIFVIASLFSDELKFPIKAIQNDVFVWFLGVGSGPLARSLSP